MTNQILQGDNLSLLDLVPEKSVRLVYIDPPFNTGKVQKRDRISVVETEDPEGRAGFGGKKYEVEEIDSPTYQDSFDDFEGFLMPRIEKAIKCLTEDGSLFVHLDYREVHYIKVALDKLLGRNHFMNEIIWSYDYGARSKKKWSCKHDTILWYVMNPKNYVFHYDAMDRIPYMAPGLVGEEKAAKGKTPTDVWWNTIVPTNGKEKTGYPTQKPLKILERIMTVHTDPGDTVLDFFGGSGTTGEAAALHGRKFILMDQNPDAVDIMKKRLAGYLVSDGS